MEIIFLIFATLLPTLLLTWFLPKKWQMFPMPIATAGFLIYLSPISFVILSFTTLMSFFFIKNFKSITTATILIICQLVAIFIFFKLQLGSSFNFIDSKVLPLGLSYYSFRQIHYTLEAYKNKLPKHTFFQYLNYLFFLPTILIGPINRFPAFLKNLERRRWDSNKYSLGLERILYGLVKIIVLGNYAINYKMHEVAIQVSKDYIWFGAYLKMFNFFANVYFQFAGFSDLAIGLSLLFGFKINENFNFPFIAQNISDFWKRWHISLSEWCKEYVFYPIVSISRNINVGILFTMLTLALWHEISMRYILWGALHALAINLYSRYERTSYFEFMSKFPYLQKVLGIFITLHFVMLSFVIVSQNSMSESIEFYKILFFIKS